jgi:Bacterial SH3 domain
MGTPARLSAKELSTTGQLQGRVAGHWGACWYVWLLIIALLSITGQRQAVADPTSAAPPSAQEPVTGSLPRGIVTTMANLRAAPSMQSEVVAVAKDRMPVEILAETGRWYRVRTEDGLEAWIGKSLVVIESTPLKTRTTVSTKTDFPETSPLKDVPTAPPMRIDPPPTTDEDPPAPPAAVPAWETNLTPPQSESVAFFSVEQGEASWSVDTLLMYVRSLEAYLFPSLLLILTLAIVTQLRAARQLRRAMYEMGLILDIIEDISAQGFFAQTEGSQALPHGARRAASVMPVQGPTVEFSPVERAVLQALSHQREVPEGELADILTQQGFSGTLVKAVMAEILRKTKATGQPLVGVRYTQSGYTYQLRSGESTPQPRVTNRV